MTSEEDDELVTPGWVSILVNPIGSRSRVWLVIWAAGLCGALFGGIVGILAVLAMMWCLAALQWTDRHAAWQGSEGSRPRTTVPPVIAWFVAMSLLVLHLTNGNVCPSQATTCTGDAGQTVLFYLALFLLALALLVGLVFWVVRTLRRRNASTQ
jgi:hypothetical protein